MAFEGGGVIIIQRPLILGDLPERWRTKFRINPLTGCWLWTAWNNGKGYGKVSVNGRDSLAHRAVFERMFCCTIPAKAHLDHLCRTRLCVNPWHMQVVTPGENTYRGNAVLFKREVFDASGRRYTEEVTRDDLGLHDHEDYGGDCDSDAGSDLVPDDPEVGNRWYN